MKQAKMLKQLAPEIHDEPRRDDVDSPNEIRVEYKDSSEKIQKYQLDSRDQYVAKGVFYLKEGDNWNDLAKMASSEKNLAIKIDEMIQAEMINEMKVRDLNEASSIVNKDDFYAFSRDFHRKGVFLK